MSHLEDIIEDLEAQYADATVAFEGGKLKKSLHAQQRQIILVRSEGKLKFSKAPGRAAFGVAIDGAGTMTNQRFERTEVLQATLRAANQDDLDDMFDRFVNTVFEVYGPNAFEDVNDYEWFQGDSAAGGDWVRRNPSITLTFSIRLKSRSVPVPFAVVGTATGEVTMGDETADLPDLPVPEYNPGVVSVTTGSATLTTADSLFGAVVPLPDFEADDIFVLAIGDSNQNTVTMNAPPGWTSVSPAPLGTIGSRVDVFWRRMVGGELSWATVVPKALSRRTWTLWQIRGADPDKSPEATSVAVGSGITALNTGVLTPTWGPVRTVWLQYLHCSGQIGGVTTFPTGYTNTGFQATDEPVGIPLSGCSQAYCNSGSALASEPSRFWNFPPAANTRSCGVTIAVGGN
jgi:hypothetical protein